MPADAMTPEFDLDAILDLITASLDEDKAEDIVAIDVRGKSSVCDGLVIASGRSNRHVGALADHLLRRLKEAGHGRVRCEGMTNCDWVLIDAGDVVVHLFRPDVRDFYNLERIWGVDVPLRPLNGPRPNLLSDENAPLA